MLNFTADCDERLDRFLARILPDFSRTKLAKMAASGEVLVEGKPEKPSFGLRSGMKVELPHPPESTPHDLTPHELDLDVLFEDECLLVVNKPRGLAVHPAVSLKEPSLVNALLARSHELSKAGGDFRPGIVHRLDKDTTGLIIVAKTDVVHSRLARQIESKATRRRYVAVVRGAVDLERFDVSAPIGRSKRNRILMAVDSGGRAALTHFKTLGVVPSGTILGADLETGRTHQIRVHLQSIGHPVLGDRLYAHKDAREGPLQLHAAFLCFKHPVTDMAIRIFAPLPEDFIGRDYISAESIEPF